MRRRDLLLLGTAAIAWPTVARTQTSGGIVPVIGFLGSAPAAAWQPVLTLIRQGLSETGFTEGKNIVIEYRWADDHYDRLPALAVELAQKDIAATSTRKSRRNDSSCCTRRFPRRPRSRCSLIPPTRSRRNRRPKNCRRRRRRWVCNCAWPR